MCETLSRVPERTSPVSFTLASVRWTTRSLILVCHLPTKMLRGMTDKVTPSPVMADCHVSIRLSNAMSTTICMNMIMY